VANGKLWSKEELEFLKKNYKRWGIEYCAKKLQRSAGTVRWRSNQMGLHVRTAHWSPKELDVLKAAWPHASYREMVHALPGRTFISIRKKAGSLKLGPRLATLLSVPEAANKVGVGRRQLLKIMELEEVKPVALNWGTTTVQADPNAKGNFRLQSSKTVGRVLKFYEHQVIAGAKSYFARETVEDACKRLGKTKCTLNRICRHYKLPKLYRKYRLKAKEWDEIFELWTQYTKARHAAAAAKNGASSSRKKAQLSALAAASTVPMSIVPDTGNVPSISLRCLVTTPTACISES